MLVCLDSTGQDEGDVWLWTHFVLQEKEKGDFKSNLEIIRTAALVTGQFPEVAISSVPEGWVAPHQYLLLEWGFFHRKLQDQTRLSAW